MDGAPLSLDWHFHLKIPIEYLGYGGTPLFSISHTVNYCWMFKDHFENDFISKLIKSSNRTAD